MARKCKHPETFVNEAGVSVCYQCGATFDAEGNETPAAKPATPATCEHDVVSYTENGVQHRVCWKCNTEF